MARRVVIVGASLAGLRAAETLRTEGFEGSVVLIGAERHLPYDRPPLSKKLLGGEWEPDRIALRKPDEYASLDFEMRLGERATALDVHARRVTLASGENIAYDGLVIATGSAPGVCPISQSSLVSSSCARSTIVLRSAPSSIVRPAGCS